jgi:hypothetical protein
LEESIVIVADDVAEFSNDEFINHILNKKLDDFSE